MANQFYSHESLISCISFNMHGINQGINCLDELCSSNTDIIMLQEIWLESDAIIKTFDCFSNNYHLFCASPLDDRLGTGILKGRPYGGICILVRKTFYNLFSSVECIHANQN